MAADCAYELEGTNVHCISLWPGLVKTENFKDLFGQLGSKTSEELIKIQDAQRVIWNV